MNYHRLIAPAALALFAALPALAQSAPASVTLAPAPVPGTVYTYALTLHSEITHAAGTSAAQSATLDNTAEVEEKVLPPSGPPGSVDVQLRFLSDKTSVQAPLDLLSGLQQQVQSSDQAALSMQPVHFRIGPGPKFETVSRSGGDDYDQAVLILDQIARTDSLPSGPTQVGDRWTRPREQMIPTMHFSVPLTLDCSLTAIGGTPGRPTATVTVHSHGASALPEGALPDLSQMASAGIVPKAALDFTSDATSEYSVPAAVLQSSSSHSHNVLHLTLVGAPPESQISDTTIDSTGTVKLTATQAPGK